SSTERSPTSVHTLSLHDALPICILAQPQMEFIGVDTVMFGQGIKVHYIVCRGNFQVMDAYFHRCLLLVMPMLEGVRRQRVLALRSEEHTSELQSRFDLVCRLLLEKKNEQLIKYSKQLK